MIALIQAIRIIPQLLAQDIIGKEYMAKAVVQDVAMEDIGQSRIQEAQEAQEARDEDMISGQLTAIPLKR